MLGSIQLVFEVYEIMRISKALPRPLKLTEVAGLEFKEVSVTAYFK